MANSSEYDSFEAVKGRLDEIVDAVGDDNLPLDDALALYEEAVSLGLRASDLLEENISAREVQDAAEQECAAAENSGYGASADSAEGTFSAGIQPVQSDSTGESPEGSGNVVS